MWKLLWNKHLIPMPIQILTSGLFVGLCFLGCIVEDKKLARILEDFLPSVDKMVWIWKLNVENYLLFFALSLENHSRYIMYKSLVLLICEWLLQFHGPKYCTLDNTQYSRLERRAHMASTRPCRTLGFGIIIDFLC